MIYWKGFSTLPSNFCYMKNLIDLRRWLEFSGMIQDQESFVMLER